MEIIKNLTSDFVLKTVKKQLSQTICNSFAVHFRPAYYYGEG